MVAVVPAGGHGNWTELDPGVQRTDDQPVDREGLAGLAETYAGEP
ncbi:MAG: hypothetical protein U5R31_05280 [Acidimicrobiia bacterium]|nr:hypothetical protein [Acidimicrobiia bacterium]